MNTSQATRIVIQGSPYPGASVRDIPFTVHHTDHGVTEGQMEFVLKQCLLEVDSEFFILRVELPEELGTVPCGLYGPAMGDDPIKEIDVQYESRGDRPWKDRIYRPVDTSEDNLMLSNPDPVLCKRVDMPPRPVNYAHVIGTKVPNTVTKKDAWTIFTVFGGPLAPQHPEDPNCNDPHESELWWNDHALVNPSSLKGE